MSSTDGRLPATALASTREDMRRSAVPGADFPAFVSELLQSRPASAAFAIDAWKRETDGEISVFWSGFCAVFVATAIRLGCTARPTSEAQQRALDRFEQGTLSAQKDFAEFDAMEWVLP